MSDQWHCQASMHWVTVGWMERRGINQTRRTTRGFKVMPTPIVAFLSPPQPHLDVAGRAHVVADVAADALRVIGIDVAAGGGFCLVYLEHRLLRAVHHAVVAFEALAAAHAALRFRHRLRVAETFHPLLV